MKTQLKYLSLATAILVISFGGVQTAEAKLKVRAKVRTPRVSVRVNTAPAVHGRVVVRRAPLPTRCHEHYEITKKDRKISKRLARYSDVKKRELLNLRRQGYRWSEIGRWLDLPRGAVKAARDKDSWKRYLRMEDRYGRGYRGWEYDERDVCYHR